MASFDELFFSDFTPEEITAMRGNLEHIYGEAYAQYNGQRARMKAWRNSGSPGESPYEYVGAKVASPVREERMPVSGTTNSFYINYEAWTASKVAHYYGDLINTTLRAMKNERRHANNYSAHVCVTNESEQMRNYLVSLYSSRDLDMPTPEEFMAAFDRREALPLDPEEAECLGRRRATYTKNKSFLLDPLTPPREPQSRLDADALHHLIAATIRERLPEAKRNLTYMGMNAMYPNGGTLEFCYTRLRSNDVIRDTLLSVLPASACRFGTLKAGESFGGSPTPLAHPGRTVSVDVTAAQLPELIAAFETLQQKEKGGRAA